MNEMGQSFNILNGSTSAKYMNDLAVRAWKKGLKTTYYWRNRAASKIEKSTSEAKSIITITADTVQVESTGPVEYKACSIEAMRRGEICESCQ